MKSIFGWLVALSFLMQSVSIGADYGDEKKSPDFSPPKDMTGPVFPMEDVIGKPNPETGRFLTEFINMATTLGLLISLIFIIAWFLKRMLNAKQEQANSTSLIKITERRSLSPKTVIYLLDVEGTSLVIAESHNGVTQLAQYPTPETATDSS
jgi:flagellar biogenesis protein FliO